MSIASLGDARSLTGVHPPQDQETAAEPRTRRGTAKSIVLAIAGTAGVLSILWLIASGSFGLSVIVFKTGSMAPTMPTGAMAITRSIPASAIKVGDVVTVPVPGKILPVTHRVVSIAKVAAVPDDRSVVLKGDDNLTADQTPYTVGRVKRVVFSMPVLGTVLALCETPPFIGLMFLVVAALVLWAFWPTDESASSTVRANTSFRHSSQRNKHERVR